MHVRQKLCLQSQIRPCSVRDTNSSVSMQTPDRADDFNWVDPWSALLSKREQLKSSSNLATGAVSFDEKSKSTNDDDESDDDDASRTFDSMINALESNMQDAGLSTAEPSESSTYHHSNEDADDDDHDDDDDHHHDDDDDDHDDDADDDDTAIFHGPAMKFEEEMLLMDEYLLDHPENELLLELESKFEQLEMMESLERLEQEASQSEPNNNIGAKKSDLCNPGMCAFLASSQFGVIRMMDHAHYTCDCFGNQSAAHGCCESCFFQQHFYCSGARFVGVFNYPCKQFGRNIRKITEAGFSFENAERALRSSFGNLAQSLLLLTFERSRRAERTIVIDIEGKYAREGINEENNDNNNNIDNRNNHHLSDYSSLCVICLERPRCVLLLPCKHVCLCEECAALSLNACPLDRTKISDTMRVYL